eukprot:gnl/TRDRNA2_/TRDRNA2_168045_c0_seq1.p2 gnl/TRDRNA2_/TRDRNA2_168045_c0~~gnl/TRDRNA2_/TRDRNA2_168045_c0_seq1.p2  ORF type:complete len:163 (-),score=18.54 gnl/TRDRNA2_/TRDRNA2_168045_c0_seq1:134-622(-)
MRPLGRLVVPLLLAPGVVLEGEGGSAMDMECFSVAKYDVVCDEAKCPEGTELSYEECGVAHEAFAQVCKGLPTGDIRKESWDGPYGCHIHVHDHDHAIFQWNDKEPGRKSEGHHPICKLVTDEGGPSSTLEASTSYKASVGWALAGALAGALAVLLAGSERH